MAWQVQAIPMHRSLVVPKTASIAWGYVVEAAGSISHTRIGLLWILKRLQFMNDLYKEVPKVYWFQRRLGKCLLFFQQVYRNVLIYRKIKFVVYKILDPFVA